MVGWCHSISQSQPSLLLKYFDTKAFSVSNACPRPGLSCRSPAKTPVPFVSHLLAQTPRMLEQIFCDSHSRGLQDLLWFFWYANPNPPSSAKNSTEMTRSKDGIPMTVVWHAVCVKYLSCVYRTTGVDHSVVHNLTWTVAHAWAQMWTRPSEPWPTCLLTSEPNT